MESIKKNKSEIFFYIFTAQKRKRDYDFLSEHESIAVDGATVWLLYEEY